jgi:hypothetical protein
MSFSDKFKQIVGTVAPTLGAALGGPFGALAGKLLHDALDTKGDDKALEAAITSGDPNVLLKLKEADQNFTVQMEKLGIDRDKLVYDDRANARAREIAVKDKTPANLAYAITVGFFGTLSFMLVNGKPATGGDALLVMLGSLGTAWAGIVAYYFGSSAGSAKKTELMAQR